MLNKFLVNILDVNTELGGNEIKVYNKDDVSKFGILVDSIIVTGESKTYIPEITKAFGITAIKLLKQMLSNKDLKENGTFELIKENNTFTEKEEISVLRICNDSLSADIRLASEDVLQKIPIAKNIVYNAVCKDIETENITKLIKNIEILQNNDDYLTIEEKSEINELYLKSGKTGQNILKIKCPFDVNSNDFQNSAKYKCKDLITALKIVSKFEKADIQINNNGLFTLTSENDFIKININVRGSIIENN